MVLPERLDSKLEWSSAGAGTVGLLIFVASFIFLASSMGRAIAPYDEGLILVGATRVGEGAVPYRDFYAVYGPAQFYVLAALFKLFGASVLVERAWDTIVRAALVAIAYAILRRATSPREASFGAALVLIWMGAFGSYGFPVFPALLFSLGSALMLQPTFEGTRSRSRLFASGVSLGIAVLFRYDVGFYAWAAMTLTLGVCVLAQDRPLSERAADLRHVLMPWWLGLGLVCVPVAVAFAIGGVVQAFVFDIFVYPTHFYTRMRSLTFPGVRDLTAAPLRGAVYLPIIVWISAIAAAANRGHDRARPGAAARPWIMLLVGMLSAFFYAKGWVRTSVIHMALSIVPALMLAAMLLPYAGRSATDRIGFPARAAAWLGLLAVIVPTLLAFQKDAAAVTDTLAWAMRASTWTPARAEDQPTLASCRPAPGLEAVACFAIDQARADTVRFVEAHTGPTDPIFVGLPRHDRILVNDMLVYFAARRRPATKWYHFDPGLQTGRDVQAEIVADLKAAKPPFVVLDAEWDRFDEPNESSVASGVTLLDDFILAHYRPVQTFGTFTVLEAKAG